MKLWWLHNEWEKLLRNRAYLLTSFLKGVTVPFRTVYEWYFRPLCGVRETSKLLSPGHPLTATAEFSFWRTPRKIHWSGGSNSSGTSARRSSLVLKNSSSYICLQNFQLKYLVLGWKTAALPHRFLRRRDIQSLAKRCSYPSDPSPMWRWGAKDWYHHGCLTLQDHLLLRSLGWCPLLLHSPNAARSPWLRSRGDLFGSLRFGLFDLSPNILDNRVWIK